jgi:hypothetical protein
MSAAENIYKRFDNIKIAIGYLEDLKPVNNDLKSIERMERDAKVHKDVIIGEVFALVGGLLLDINRIANALEESSKPAPLLSTRTGSHDPE